MSKENEAPVGGLPDHLNLRRDKIIPGMTPTQMVMTWLHDQLERGRANTHELRVFLKDWDKREAERRGSSPWTKLLAKAEDQVADDDLVTGQWMVRLVQRVLIDRGDLIGERVGEKDEKRYVGTNGEYTAAYYALVQESERWWGKIVAFGAQPEVEVRRSGSIGMGVKRPVGDGVPDAGVRAMKALELAYNEFLNSKLAQGIGLGAALAAAAEATVGCAQNRAAVTEVVIDAATPMKTEAADPKPPQVRGESGRKMPPRVIKAANRPEPETLEPPESTPGSTATTTPEKIISDPAIYVPDGSSDWYEEHRNDFRIWIEAWAARGIIFKQPTSPGSTEVAPHPTLRDVIIGGINGAQPMLGWEVLGEGPYKGQILTIPLDIFKSGFQTVPAMSDKDDPGGATRPLFLDFDALSKAGLTLMNNGTTYLAVDEGGRTVKYLDRTGNWVVGQPTPGAPKATEVIPTTTSTEAPQFNYQPCLGNSTSLAEVVGKGCQSPDPLTEPDKFVAWYNNLLAFLKSNRGSYVGPVVGRSGHGTSRDYWETTDQNNGALGTFVIIHDGQPYPVVIFEDRGIVRGFVIVGGSDPAHVDATLTNFGTDGMAVRIYNWNKGKCPPNYSDAERRLSDEMHNFRELMGIEIVVGMGGR